MRIIPHTPGTKVNGAGWVRDEMWKLFYTNETQIK